MVLSSAGAVGLRGGDRSKGGGGYGYRCMLKLAEAKRETGGPKPKKKKNHPGEGREGRRGVGETLLIRRHNRHSTFVIKLKMIHN